MTQQVNLLTSNDAFHQLHELADGKKSTVRVGRQQLLHLLIDYSVMLAALSGNNGFKVIEPAALRARPRLNLNGAATVPSKAPE
jgi:hypothetical protein